MADSILRLKVESQEYDNKLKQATNGLTRYVDECRKVGGTLEVVEKETLDYVRALGQMETTSRTATGKLAEMKKTFTELAAQYKQMTDAEKQSPFGKALAASLDELKGRIGESKTQLEDINTELGNTKQAEDSTKNGLEGLNSALGINMKSLVGWGTALTAGKAALDVAKDAFFASESTVDEWGRTIQSVKGVYEGFLNAINTGDISGFLSRMDDIVRAAREAYDEMDKLGSMKTIQAPKISAQQTENERIRMMIQTGRYIAPIDGRGNAVFNGREMQNGDKLTAGQIRYLEKQLEGGMQKMVGLVENEVKQTGKAIDAYYNSIAKQNGMSLQEFKKGTSTWEEFSKKIQGYDEYQKWRSEHTTIDISTGREIVARGNPYEEYAKWGNFRVDKMGENSFNDLVRLIQQRDQQAAQAYGMMSQAYRTMNRAEGFTVSKLLRPGSGSGKGGKTTNQKIQFADDSIMAQEKLVQDLTMKWKTASAAVKDDYKKQLDAAQTTLDKMMGKTAKAAAQPQTVIGLSGFNEQTIAAWTSMIKSDLAKADIGSDMYNNLTRNLRDMSFLTTTVQDAIKLGLDIPQNEVQQMFEKVFDQGNLPSDMYTGMIQKFIDDFKNRTGKDLIVGKDGSLSEQEVKKEDEVKEFTESVGKLSGGLSQVTGGLKSVGIEIPKEIDQVIGVISGVGQVVSGVGTIISLFSTTAMTANTTAVGLNTAAIASLIAALEFNTATNFIPFFSGGGVVGRAASGLLVGNHKSGDNLRMPVMGGSGGYIGINDGELILNRAQQSNLVGQLEGNGLQNLQLEAILYGEDIRLVLNRNGRRTGRGEYVQSRNIRLW